MYTIRQGSRICIDAPAKINLFLELRERRSDGYHELETLMVPISLYDRLTITPQQDTSIQFTARWVTGARDVDPLPETEDNLAYRALECLRERGGESRGARVTLVKRIPSQAGMGGASSDAAAALLAGNFAWNLNWSVGQLAEVGQELGSDVPFFLSPGLSRCTGRGEVVTRQASCCSLPIVVVKPAAGLSTRAVYERATVPDRPRASQPLAKALGSGRLDQLAAGLFNRLQGVAATLAPCIDTIAQFFSNTDVYGHQMSGSGTSYFAVCRNRRHAGQIAARARASGLGTVFSATTIGPQLVL